MPRKVRRCVICGVRPQRIGGQCTKCHRQSQAAKRNGKPPQPRMFLTYREYVVGLYPNGKDSEGNQTYRGRLLHRDPEKLPKSRTLDLNTYLPGFTREQVKRLKAKVLAVAEA